MAFYWYKSRYALDVLVADKKGRMGGCVEFLDIAFRRSVNLWLHRQLG
jgi:hypothetical protein